MLLFNGCYTVSGTNHQDWFNSIQSIIKMNVREVYVGEIFNHKIYFYPFNQKMLQFQSSSFNIMNGFENSFETLLLKIKSKIDDIKDENKDNERFKFDQFCMANKNITIFELHSLKIILSPFNTERNLVFQITQENVCVAYGRDIEELLNNYKMYLNNSEVI